MKNTWSSRNIWASVLMTSFKRICPTNLLLDGNRSSFRGTKRPGCEADYLPPSRSHVKKEWRCTSAPPPLSAFMAWPGTNLFHVYFILYTVYVGTTAKLRHLTAQRPRQMYFIKQLTSPNSWFRTIKFLTDYRIHLRDAEGKLVPKQVGTTASKFCPALRCWTLRNV